MPDEIKLVDTTLRDGHQSLWACRMRAKAMLPVLPDLDAAGFDSAEFTVPNSQFSRAVRDLHEDPWDWLKLGTRRVKDTPLRLHGTAGSPFLKVPKVIEELLLQKFVDLGIRTVRISDPWNEFSNLVDRISQFDALGVAVVLNVVYSESPRHTTEYFAQKVQEAAELQPYRICFKDVGGLLTPEKAALLLPIVVEKAADIPLEFHGHCSSGFAPYIALMAAEAGISFIHTAIPPLADGCSLPSAFSVVENLRARGFVVNIDTERLARISDHLGRVARAERLPAGRPLAYDEHLYSHQVPGGMISNLGFQLAKLRMADRLPETLQEVARVRADLGYPIMVTPLSQFVGSQAALNVLTGGRYESVTDEIIEYALGKWGAEGAAQMDEAVRRRILDRPRAEEVEARHSAVEPSLDELRRGFPERISDEELITRMLSGVGNQSLDLRNPPKADYSYEDYRREHDPVVALIEQAAGAPDIRTLRFKDDRLDVTIQRA